jgi:hypothetical protein
MKHRHADRCLELFFGVCRERSGRRIPTAAPVRGAQLLCVLDDSLAPRQQLSALLEPERRGALRRLFTHTCYNVAGRAGAAHDRCAMGLGQWLVMLREAGVLRATGLHGAVAAFLEVSRLPFAGPRTRAHHAGDIRRRCRRPRHVL